MKDNSRRITTNQTGVHEHLTAIVAAHRDADFRKPIAPFSEHTFETLVTLVSTGDPWILDSGCGTGESTRQLAVQFPDHRVIGIDRSAARLERQRSDWPANATLLRGDLVDLWRLLRRSDLTPARHYVLYPNPYPKKQQVRRRWHGHPVFPDLVAISPYLELRSNWRLYLEECALALSAFGRQSELNPVSEDSADLTAFERKYRRSGQTCWRLIARDQE